MVSIKGLFASLTAGLREQKKTKAWVETTPKQVGEAIAKINNLEFSGQEEQAVMQRKDQRQESDLEFLTRVAKEKRLNIKVHNNKVFMYQPLEIEKQEPFVYMQREGLELYSFKHKTQGTFDICCVQYFNPETKESADVFYPTAFGTAKKKVKKLETRAEFPAEARRMAKNGL